MKELEVEVKLLISDEYEDTFTKHIQVPTEIPEDRMVDVIDENLTELMDKDYNTHEDWEDCSISWTLDSWKVV